MLAFVDLEKRVPRDHPLRAIKRLADAALEELGPVFGQMFALNARPSILPERLLKAADRLILGAKRARLLGRVGVSPALSMVSGYGPD